MGDEFYNKNKKVNITRLVEAYSKGKYIKISFDLKEHDKQDVSRKQHALLKAYQTTVDIQIDRVLNKMEDTRLLTILGIDLTLLNEVDGVTKAREAIKERLTTKGIFDTIQDPKDKHFINNFIDLVYKLTTKNVYKELNKGYFNKTQRDIEDAQEVLRTYENKMIMSAVKNFQRVSQDHVIHSFIGHEDFDRVRDDIKLLESLPDNYN